MKDWEELLQSKRVAVKGSQQSTAVLCAVLSHVWLWNRIDCSPPGSSVYGDSPGQNTGAGCQALLQGIFLTQEPNQSLLHCRQIFYHLSYHSTTAWWIIRIQSKTKIQEARNQVMRENKPFSMQAGVGLSV